MDTVLIWMVAIWSVMKTSVSLLDEEQIKYTYNAAVVQYKSNINESISAEEKVAQRTRDYISLLKSAENNLDIILFPEATLIPHGEFKLLSTEVPEPFKEILCNSTGNKYQFYIKTFSCAAIEHNTTIVINLIEKNNCSLTNATGKCPSSGVLYHNTDVAFNEDGYVSGRYRKYNLFGELQLSAPPEAELVTITTKSNDTFGIFTCFDIIFSQPALNLTRDLGIKNILFPTMWFSELPYLTALQVQQMWAHENNVTFLSAGASNPKIGSGGSGIFVGENGPLFWDMVGGTRLMEKRVPRQGLENNPYVKINPLVEDNNSLAKNLDTLYLIKDPSLTHHSSVILETNKTDIFETICNGNIIKTCCQFDIKISLNQSNTGKYQYTYHLAAFNGIRTFSGIRDGGIESCAILACLNSSLSSCGERFTNYTEIYFPVTFEYISVVANFTSDDNRIQFPNSLLASIRPIIPQYTIWKKEHLGDVIKRTHMLTEPQNRILTFGIFGRNFDRDSVRTKPNNGHKLASMGLFSYLFLILCYIASLK